jgi:hypothetical protein
MQNIFEHAPLIAEVTVLPAAPEFSNKKEISEYCYIQITNSLSIKNLN